MSNAGRKPTPSALKLVQGNPGKRKINKNEPKPKAVRPRCPAHLEPMAKTKWKQVCGQLEQMGLMAEVDLTALELLCETYAEKRELQKQIKLEGRTYETTSTTGDRILKANPAVAMASDAHKRINALLSQFGLGGPSSRARLEADGGKEVDPLEEYLKKKKR